LILNDWTRCLPTKLETEVSSLSPVQQRHPWRGYFFIAAATFCWAAGASFAKGIFSGRLFPGQPLISPLVFTQTRTTFAVIVLGSFLFLRNGVEMFRISRRDLALCILTGTLGLAGSNFFYYVAIQKTTVAMAITVQNTAPVWVLLYMVLRGKQRATPERILAVLLALVGIAMAIGLFYSGLKLNLLGVGSALLAAFSFCLYNVAGQGLVARCPPLKIMFFALLSSAVMWLVFDPPWTLAAQHFTLPQWEFMFAFGCFSMLLPYVFYFSGLKYLDPTRAVVTSCLEPVFAILFAALFVGETVRLLQVIGIAAVLTATVIVQKSGH